MKHQLKLVVAALSLSLPVLLSPVSASAHLRVDSAVGAGHAHTAAVAHGSPGGAEPQYENAQPATFAPGVQSTMPYGPFNAVSCSAPGYCTAAGVFVSVDGQNLPFTQTSIAGVWQTAVPADVSGINGSYGTFNAISCTAPGFCTVAGSYGQQAITATSAHGVWTPVVLAQFGPSTARSGDGPNDAFSTVTCSSPGNCTAAGGYADENGYVVPMTESSINGVWQPAVPIKFPDDFNHDSVNSFHAVSCSSAGNCAAVGYAFDFDINNVSSFSSTSTNGVWAPAVVLRNSTLVAVSCPAVGQCTAAGSMKDADDSSTAITVPLISGSWRSPNVAVIDSALLEPYGDGSSFNAIDCASIASCTAVGTYGGLNWIMQSLVASSTNGVWTTTAPMQYPGAHTPGNFNAGLFAVSCSRAFFCSAAGYLQAVEGGYEAVTVTQRNGVWGEMIPATFANGVANTRHDDFFTSISCAAAGSCTAAGSYTAPGEWYPAMTQSFTSVSSAFPTNVSIIAAAGHAIVSWSDPVAPSETAITGFDVTIRRAATDTVVATRHVVASLHQLVVSVPSGSYVAVVVAVSADGTSADVTTEAVAVPSSRGVRIPPAPRGLMGTPSNGAVKLSWLPPVLSDGGSAIYQYIASDGRGHTCVTGTDARVAVRSWTCTVTGLKNGLFYRFTVRAVNIIGMSEPSPEKLVGPASVPTSAPTVSVASLTNHRATLDVVAPADMGGRPLQRYRVSFNNGRTWLSLFYFTSGDQVYLGRLKPRTTYHVLICAVNQIGASPPAPLTFTTAS